MVIADADSAIARTRSKVFFFFGILASIVIGTGINAYAACPTTPLNGWHISEHSATLASTLSYAESHALQGVKSFSVNGTTRIALTHGYTSYNATILDEAGQLVARVALDDTLPAPLIADVAVSDDSLWWTDYRFQRLYRSDFNLEQVSTVTLPENIGTLVGLTFLPEMDAIVFPIRRQPFGFGIVSSNPTDELSEVTITTALTDPYDVSYGGGCMFLVDRAAGNIFTVPVAELANGGAISLQPFAQGLERPQHIDVAGGELFVIETAARQVSRFDIRQGRRLIYQLPIDRIFRGLTVLSSTRLGLTGFVGEGDAISESETGLFLIDLE